MGNNRFKKKFTEIEALEKICKDKNSHTKKSNAILKRMRSECYIDGMGYKCSYFLAELAGMKGNDAFNLFIDNNQNIQLFAKNLFIKAYSDENNYDEIEANSRFVTEQMGLDAESICESLSFVPEITDIVDETSSLMEQIDEKTKEDIELSVSIIKKYFNETTEFIFCSPKIESKILCFHIDDHKTYDLIFYPRKSIDDIVVLICNLIKKSEKKTIEIRNFIFQSSDNFELEILINLIKCFCGDDDTKIVLADEIKNYFSLYRTLDSRYKAIDSKNNDYFKNKLKLGVKLEVFIGRSPIYFNIALSGLTIKELEILAITSGEDRDLFYSCVEYASLVGKDGLIDAVTSKENDDPREGLSDLKIKYNKDLIKDVAPELLSIKAKNDEWATDLTEKILKSKLGKSHNATYIEDDTAEQMNFMFVDPFNPEQNNTDFLRCLIFKNGTGPNKAIDYLLEEIEVHPKVSGQWFSIINKIISNDKGFNEKITLYLSLFHYLIEINEINEINDESYFEIKNSINRDVSRNERFRISMANRINPSLHNYDIDWVNNYSTLKDGNLKKLYEACNQDSKLTWRCLHAMMEDEKNKILFLTCENLEEVKDALEIIKKETSVQAHALFSPVKTPKGIAIKRPADGEFRFGISIEIKNKHHTDLHEKESEALWVTLVPIDKKLSSEELTDYVVMDEEYLELNTDVFYEMNPDEVEIILTAIKIPKNINVENLVLI